MVTVLSIDGGGIRGIIPSTILGFLESKLQVGNLSLNLSCICMHVSICSYNHDLIWYVYGRIWMAQMQELQIILT